MRSIGLAAIELFLALVLASCAAVSEQESEAREYRDTDWRLRYLAYADTCSRAGGRMIVHRSTRAGSANVPRRSDRFRCTTYIGNPPKH